MSIQQEPVYMRIRSFIVGCVCLLAGSTSAFAQTPSWHFGVSAARVDYDLSGTGTASGIAAGAARQVTPRLDIEIRGLFAQPLQQSGPSTLVAPDLQLHYRWNLARLSPYVGGGVGLAAVTSASRTDWDPTMSVAVGTRVRLTRRLGLVGEMRIRGIEWDFDWNPANWNFPGSTGEFSAGVAWSL
jgi:hypothetical protein